MQNIISRTLKAIHIKYYTLTSPPTMPPIPSQPTTSNPSASKTPRLILYHQTHYSRASPSSEEAFLSALPLATNRSGLTHLILAALHINADPSAITLNDDPADSPRAARVWQDARRLRAEHGIPVLAMLGGAAKGTYGADRLDSPNRSVFLRYYAPLRALVAREALDGLDLDVEEPMSLAGIVRLVTHLHADFGPGFLITLAPVAPALAIPAFPRLSGFDYFALEIAVGHLIAWYNVQFYCGWGTLASSAGYEQIIARGWDARRVVAGTLTNPEGAEGWVEDEELAASVARWDERFGKGGWGGIMGWEYFGAFCVRFAGEGPEEWARMVGGLVGLSREQEEVEGVAADEPGESLESKVGRPFEG